MLCQFAHIQITKYFQLNLKGINFKATMSINIWHHNGIRINFIHNTMISQYASIIMKFSSIVLGMRLSYVVDYHICINMRTNNNISMLVFNLVFEITTILSSCTIGETRFYLNFKEKSNLLIGNIVSHNSSKSYLEYYHLEDIL